MNASSRIALLSLVLASRLGAQVVAAPFYQIVAGPFSKVSASDEKPSTCSLFGLQLRTAGADIGWEAVVATTAENRFTNSGVMYPVTAAGTRTGPDQWMTVHFTSTFQTVMAGPRLGMAWGRTTLSASQLWGWGTYVVTFPEFHETYGGSAPVFQTNLSAERKLGPVFAEATVGYLQAVSPSLVNADGYSVQGVIDYGGFTARLSLGFSL